MSVRLGPFQLLAPLDAGGMASIWTGRHLESGTPIAAKLIPPGELTPQTRATLEREIRTAASLDHPGIVCIVDQGTIDEEASRASEGLIETGAPYLLMEYCSHTLSSLLPLTTWGELRTILVSLLDALAYAHARGVIHRDLKPGNVLFGGPDDLRPGLKISDFGIAHALDRADPETGTRKLVGTPRYMAPEQVEGETRLLGPGTDLYALAGLVFKCLHGHGPFRTSGPRLLYDHLRTPAPPLEVPEGFPPALADWVAWMLEKDVGDRPRSAASALQALPDGPMHPLVAPDYGTDEDTATVPLAVAKPATLSLGFSDPTVDRFVPVPKNWKPARPYGGSPRLRGVGRSLLGLRPVPLAGRERERDVLWSAFRQSANRGEAVTLVLTGQEGLGRTRMAEWLGERVLELGTGLRIRVRCQRRQERGRTLRRLLAEVLRVGNAQGEALDERIELGHHRLGLESSPLTGFALQPGAETDLIAVATAQLLERLASLGPLVVTVDDLHLVPSLLEDLQTWKRIERPLLIVATVRTGDPIEAKLQDWATFTHELEPLDSTARHQLIDSILPLTPSLAAQVEERTEGIPRFAVQLITDWAQRGVLRPGPNGFQAAHDLKLPASMQAIWSSRVRHLLQGYDRVAERVLELAATLGNDVAHADLIALMPEHEAQIDELIGTMARQRLITVHDGGFVFAHPAVREVLLHRARRKGRLEGHHAAIAQLLAESTDPEEVARRGHHRAGAGDDEGAFDDLMFAASFYRQQADNRRALILCDEAEERLGPDDRRRIRVKALRARTLNSAHRTRAGRQEAEEALELAEAFGWTEEAGLAKLQLAVALYHASAYARSRELLHQVLAALPDDPESRGLALNHLGWISVMEKDEPSAIPWFKAAAEANAARGAEGRIGQLLILADVASFEDRQDEVEALLTEALELVRNPPRLYLLPYLLERRAYLALAREQLDEAHAAAMEFVQCPGMSFERVARAEALVASIEMRQERWHEAHRRFLECAQPRTLPESPLERSIIYGGLLATAAELGEQAPLESWTRSLELSVPDPPVRHPTARYVIEQAAERLPRALAQRCQQLIEGL